MLKISSLCQWFLEQLRPLVNLLPVPTGSNARNCSGPLEIWDMDHLPSKLANRGEIGSSWAKQSAGFDTCSHARILKGHRNILVKLAAASGDDFVVSILDEPCHRSDIPMHPVIKNQTRGRQRNSGGEEDSDSDDDSDSDSDSDDPDYYRYSDESDYDPFSDSDSDEDESEEEGVDRTWAERSVCGCELGFWV